jgi:hypothetical protein
MAKDMIGLQRVLGSLGLVQEEIDMWLSLGFYVSTTEVRVAGYPVKGSYYTAEGTKWHIPIEVALDLRQSLIRTRQPVPKKYTDPQYGELEVERG